MHFNYCEIETKSQLCQAIAKQRSGGNALKKV